MPSVAGAGGTPSASDPAARALEAYERHIRRLRAVPGHLLERRDWIEVERAAMADAGYTYAEIAARHPIDDTEREYRDLVRAFPEPADRAAFLERATEARREARDAGRGRSLDTWEQSHIGNSGAAPARAESGPVPPGHAARSPERDQLARGLDRAARYDAAKASLLAAVRTSAGALARVDDIAPGPAILERMADRIGACRTVRVVRDAGCGAHLAVPLSCDVRLCPDCERSRSAAYVRRLDGLVEAMTRPLSGTLTIPNVPPGYLAAGVEVILDAFARLRRTALFAGGPCRSAHQDPDDRPDRSGELPPARRPCRHPAHRAPDSRACSACGRRRPAHADGGCAFTPRACRCARCSRDGRGCRRCTHAPVAGGVYGLEVTLSAERRDWHPHVHFVADAPFLPWRELRDAWRAATCDAWRTAHARGIDERRGRGYKRQERRGRVKVPRCAHLADVQGRPANRRCSEGHGWRDRDSDRCPYQDRDMLMPCGRAGEPIDAPCVGASMVWVEDPRKRSRGSVRDALREALKYATKGVLTRDGELSAAVRDDPLLVAELLLTLRARRLVSGWGSLWGVTDDPEHADTDTVELDVGEFVPLRVPKVCPACGLEGLWHSIGTRSRAHTATRRDGRLYYHPPDRRPPP